jgi:aryl-alcohol dehydrogenase-like predicted oxidoreductase
MEHRIALGRTGLRVSPICFGTWQMSPIYWGDVSQADVIAAIEHALEVGVNFFDTAGAYGDGLAETTLGKALKNHPRSQAIIATKVYFHFHPDGKRYADLSAKYVVEYCEDALRRLQTDYIDLLQLHSFDPMTPMDETTSALEQLRKSGKIRCYGVSNFGVEQFRLARRYGDYATTQPRYSLIDRQIEQDLLPYCAAEDIGVLVYSPLARGLLTGKYDGSETFSDLRGKDPRFQGEGFKALASAVRSLEPIARKYDLTICQLVLAAMLCNHAIDCAIVGIKSPAQITEAAGSMGKTIQREDYFEIRKILSI